MFGWLRKRLKRANDAWDPRWLAQQKRDPADAAAEQKLAMDDQALLAKVEGAKPPKSPPVTMPEGTKPSAPANLVLPPPVAIPAPKK
jgi:hypothetical protein